jgi:hypothetical protein
MSMNEEWEGVRCRIKRWQVKETTIYKVDAHTFVGEGIERGIWRG